MVQTSPLDTLQQALGRVWSTINLSRTRTEQKLRELDAAIADQTTDDSAVVVFGSLARGEFTSGSDIDWTLLVDGQADVRHWDAVLEIKEVVEKAYKRPGREGTFGSFTNSHELLHKIGGGDDTNRNTTQRILLLLESTPIGRPDAHRRVIRGILDRYVLEDHGWVHSSNPSGVPRFLQNDIASYWRTVAVDFAYKRRERAGEGWALRTAKLRLSRKLTYAAGLVACFQCSYLYSEHPGLRDLEPSRRARLVVENLEAFLRHTPLEMLAWAYLRFGMLASAEKLLDAYEAFLAVLDDDEQRKRLEDLPQDKVAGNAEFDHVRELGHQFQAALNELFLPQDGKSGFYELTHTYEVF